MAEISESFFRDQLLTRRQRLESVIATARETERLAELLDEVDSALKRIDAGAYGICETCHDSIEKDRLLCDPLIRYCLDHLSAEQQRALELDLELAARIQRELLPKQDLSFAGWQTRYHYVPLGPVSGD